MRNKLIESKTFGKLILMGEHSVVYHKPAISIPIRKLRIKIKIKEASKHMLFINNNDYTNNNEVSDVNVLINKLNQDYKINKNYYIKVSTNLPHQKGLGFSAAFSVELIKAYCRYHKINITKDELVKYVLLTEKLNHLDPSGIDMMTVINNKPLYFIKEKEVRPFKINLKGYLLVVETKFKSNTKESINNLKKYINNNQDISKKLLNNLEEIAIKTKETINNQDIITLGKLFNKGHNILKKLGISHDEIDHLIRLSLDYDALGAKITGGGNGGCFIVLTNSIFTNYKIKKIMYKNNALNVYKINLRNLSW